LEDDVLTKKSFIKIMKNFALEKTAAKQNWFVIDFCQLGFIGTPKLDVDMVFLLYL
jgi:alpha-1,3-mannosylglycoprotein beta-1,4-N-acetylglucosaminyltransferase A/B